MTFEMFTATFDGSTMSRTQVQLWYSRFKEGRENDNDDAPPGRSSMPTTNDNIEVVKQMFLDNRRIAIREIADNIVISFGLCRTIFTEVFGIFLL